MWITLVCEHGVVYAVKLGFRAKSKQDFADLLNCFRHFPNIVCRDLSPRLAVHTDVSQETLPFHPHAGSFAEVTDPNIALAKKHKLSRKFPWLVEKKMFAHCKTKASKSVIGETSGTTLENTVQRLVELSIAVKLDSLWCG